MADVASAIPVVSFVGRSNSGKTTLLEKLIVLLRQRGYRVGVVKHTVRADVETDLPGTDTRRLWEAGAEHVAFVTPDRIVHTRRYTAPPPLEAALADVGDVDLIFIEGFKYGAYPKIEVVRAARDPALIPDLEGRVACVTDVPDLRCGVPCFAFDDIVGLVDFVEEQLVLRHTAEA
jgi:molybdopterin-guanine dinucleotide biosynthesis protein MobB